MEFNFDNNIPIYIQLVEQLKKYIISGKIQPGERLPSVRDLALQTKVNPNTMQKALAELEEIGLIYTERTNGKYVTTNENLIVELKNKYARNLSDSFIEEMQNIGYSLNQVLEYLNKKGGRK